MNIERLLGGVTLDRALGITDPEHVEFNKELLGAETLRSGSAVLRGVVPVEACASFVDYYVSHHCDKGLNINGVIRGGFGGRYERTHEEADHKKQKRLTVVQTNHDGSAIAQWRQHVTGFAEVETTARELAERFFGEQCPCGMQTIAWHVLEQPYGAGDSTSFGAHTDDEEVESAVVTVVVKLTSGWSRMAVEGAAHSFAYEWVAGSTAIFDARAWHRSIPQRACDPTALKIAFFYRPKRPARS